MELKWLEDYNALVSLGSFSKAAEARFVTQPAFSRRIRALEDWLGVGLVDRNQHPMTLTRAGQAFAEQSQALAGQILAIRTGMQQVEAARAQLVFVAQQALAVAFFPSWMRTLESLRGDALVKVDTGDLDRTLPGFLAGDGDFLLCYASEDTRQRLARADVQGLQVGIDQLVPVSCRSDTGEPLHGARPCQQVRAVAHPVDSFFGQIVQRDCLAVLPTNLRMEVACENTLSEALKTLVLQGFGMAWLPASLVQRELDSGELMTLDDQWPRVDLQIRLYRLQLPRSEAAARVWQHLQAMSALHAGK